MSRPLRRPALGLAALAAFGALVGASPAAADAVTTPMTCTYPLAGATPTQLFASFDAATGLLDFTTTSLGGDGGTDPTLAVYRLTKSEHVTGTLTATLGGYRGGDVPYSGTITTNLKPATVTTASSSVQLIAEEKSIENSGLDPRGNYGGFDRNDARMSVRGIALNLRATDASGKPVTLWNGDIALPPDDSDGDAATFDVRCTVNAQLYYKPDTYHTPTPTVTPRPLTPTPVTPTPTPTPTVTPTLRTVQYAYGLAGQATLKTLTTGKLPLTGRADATLQVASGNFTAALSLNQTRGNLVALGFLPVVADVQLVPQGDASGQLTDAGLTVNTKVRIKLPKVTLFGLQLAGGANCQAKNPSDIKLKSPGEFAALDGGTIAGTFTISDLTGCGGLTGLVSPLTAGKGNAIALSLSPLASWTPPPPPLTSTPTVAPTASVKRTVTGSPPATAVPVTPSPTPVVVGPTPTPTHTPTPVPRSK